MSEYRYHKVSSRFWTDEKVTQWDDDTRMLALYLLTCPHRTTEGFFRLPKPYMAADLGWDMERLAKPFDQLLKEGFLKYDERVSVVLLCKALKYQGPENPNQAKAALKAVEELPETPLRSDFQQLAKQYSQRLYELLVERYGEQPTPAPTPTPTPEAASARTREGHTPSIHPDPHPAAAADPIMDDSVTPERYYEQTIGVIGPMAADLISQSLAKGLHPSAVKWGIREFSLSNGKTPKYLAQILDRLARERLLTAEQAEAAQARDKPRGDPSEDLEARIARIAQEMEVASP